MVENVKHFYKFHEDTFLRKWNNLSDPPSDDLKSVIDFASLKRVSQIKLFWSSQRTISTVRAHKNLPHWWLCNLRNPEHLQLKCQCRIYFMPETEAIFKHRHLKWMLCSLTPRVISKRCCSPCVYLQVARMFTLCSSDTAKDSGGIFEPIDTGTVTDVHSGQRSIGWERQYCSTLNYKGRFIVASLWPCVFCNR